MLKYEKKILDNGLRVILAPMENTEAVTLLVLVGVGSRYESQKTNGVSHFLEHLFFKGTKKRPIPGQLVKELDKVGASHNAFTSQETTGFWVKTASKDFDTGLDIVSDMLLNPVFREEEIEKERGVILQEISMYKDLPRAEAHHALDELMYGNQPMGRSILGTEQTVGGIKKSDIVKYRAQNYLSENIVVVVAGNIETEEVFKKVKNAFKKTKKGRNKKSKKTRISQKNPRVRIKKKETDQTHMILSARGYSLFDNRRYALDLLSVILGGNASSKLFMEIREKLGLAYYVGAFGVEDSDCGYLGITAGVPADRLEKVVKKTLNILGGIKKRGVTRADLEDAKGYIEGQTALQFESTDNIASYVANQELYYNKIMQPQDIIKKLEKVTRNDILKIANDIFKPSKMNMAVVGKHDDFKKKEEFYKSLFRNI